LVWLKSKLRRFLIISDPETTAQAEPAGGVGSTSGIFFE